MKVKVIKKFLDKYTSKYVEVGTELEVDEKRAKVLMGKNSNKTVYVEKVDHKTKRLDSEM